MAMRGFMSGLHDKTASGFVDGQLQIACAKKYFVWAMRNFSLDRVITVCEGMTTIMRDGLHGRFLRSEPRMETRDGSQEESGASGPEKAASDEQLMAAFSRGATAAFEELFARYKQSMFGFFRRRVADREQAEELTQETFLALLRSATHYRPSATFRTYLYAIAFNVLRAYRRKAAFRAMFSGRNDREPAARDSLDAEIVLRDALSRLERVDREILLLREFEQLSYTEIAELTRLPLNTVRSRLFRARMALREMLAAPMPEKTVPVPVREEERV
jgi:RNA polymerase sigma-70 factor, ECF subfamily